MADMLSPLLDSRAVSLSIAARRKPDIIRELVALLGVTGAVTDVDRVTAEVIERENVATTGIGSGIAIPHCLSPAVRGTAIAIGRRIPGAKFDAVDKQPVQLFFLMVGLPGSHNEHLRLLSRLARFLHDPDLKAELLSAREPEEAVAAFRRREEKGAH